MKKNLSPNVKYLALKYKGVTHSTLEEAFSWAKANYKDYLNFEAKNYSLVRKETNEKYLEKEFIAKGYVLIDAFPKKRNYNYIESNRLINGKKYIYPQTCCRQYNVEGFGKLPNPYDLHNEIGIAGLTRVDVYYKL